VDVLLSADSVDVTTAHYRVCGEWIGLYLNEITGEDKRNCRAKSILKATLSTELGISLE
jgi:hypothetical protein